MPDARPALRAREPLPVMMASCDPCFLAGRLVTSLHEARGQLRLTPEVQVNVGRPEIAQTCAFGPGFAGSPSGSQCIGGRQIGRPIFPLRVMKFVAVDLFAGFE